MRRTLVPLVLTAALVAVGCGSDAATVASEETTIGTTTVIPTTVAPTTTQPTTTSAAPLPDPTANDVEPARLMDAGGFDDLRLGLSPAAVAEAVGRPVEPSSEEGCWPWWDDELGLSLYFTNPDPGGDIDPELFELTSITVRPEAVGEPITQHGLGFGSSQADVELIPGVEPIAALPEYVSFEAYSADDLHYLVRDGFVTGFVAGWIPVEGCA